MITLAELLRHYAGKEALPELEVKARTSKKKSKSSERVNGEAPKPPSNTTASSADAKEASCRQELRLVSLNPSDFSDDPEDEFVV
jgi:hypothetical protein